MDLDSGPPDVIVGNRRTLFSTLFLPIPRDLEPHAVPGRGERDGAPARSRRAAVPAGRVAVNGRGARGR